MNKPIDLRMETGETS